ncbi:hypothetical protein F0231_20450 [Vibrio sp. RE86]|uniref:hypothetical protein n=1 Tax=Vibrio sp. RE86 TaxID=2607605 RepID=UPI0014935101|nr:hypothetical protein [Vibrio sp. RE86]NOH82089.1 hypothetical protein [Vibrio sp. RE86]
MKECKTCGNHLEDWEDRCSQCKKPQGWTQRAVDWAVLLSPIVSILTIFSLSLPYAFDALQRDKPELSLVPIKNVQLRRLYGEWAVKVGVIIHNKGKVAAVVKSSEVLIDLESKYQLKGAQSSYLITDEQIVPPNSFIFMELPFSLSVSEQPYLDAQLGNQSDKSIVLEQLTVKVSFDGFDAKSYSSKFSKQNQEAFLRNY